MSTKQIKTVAFQIAEGLFNPHPFVNILCQQQQLMPNTQFAAIHNQPDLSRSQRLRDSLSDWLVPLSNSDGLIIQQALEATAKAVQKSSLGLSGNLAQMHRATGIKSTQPPSKVAKAGK